MSRFEINPGEIAQIINEYTKMTMELDQIASKLKQQGANLAATVRYENNAGIDTKTVNQIMKIQNRILSQKNNVGKLQVALNDIVQLCDNTDRKQDHAIKEMNFAGGNIDSDTLAQGSRRGELYDDEEGFKLGAYEYGGNVTKKVDWQNGNVWVNANGHASFDAVRAETRFDGDLLKAGITGTVGSVAITGAAKCALMKDGVFDPNISANVNATAKGVSVKGDIKYGNENVNITADGEGTVGYAQGNASAYIGSKGVKASANVGAAVLHGEARTAFNFFGIKVELSGEAEALSVGAGASYEATSDALELGGKLSLIAGLGFKIRLSKNT